MRVGAVGSAGDNGLKGQFGAGASFEKLKGQFTGDLQFGNSRFDHGQGRGQSVLRDPHGFLDEGDFGFVLTDAQLFEGGVAGGELGLGAAF